MENVQTIFHLSKFFIFPLSRFSFLFEELTETLLERTSAAWHQASPCDVLAGVRLGVALPRAASFCCPAGLTAEDEHENILLKSIGIICYIWYGN